jgi:hypothetical protein
MLDEQSSSDKCYNIIAEDRGLTKSYKESAKAAGET